MIVFNKDNVKFLQKRKKDDICQVFMWRNRIFRGIYPEYEAHIRTLFTTGLINELISRGYFPKTHITDYKMDGFSLIVEHKMIWPAIHPQEWTFSMLKDAALFVLNVAIIAKRYGFNMKDCHGLNILFDGIQPRFIDLGSFVYGREDYSGWMAYEEFLRFYYYPLKIWTGGNNFIAKLSIFSGNLTPHKDYWLYKVPIFRLLKPNLLDRLVRLIIRKGNTNLPKLVTKIEKIVWPKPYTEWGDYHERIKEKRKRFDRVISIINSIDDDINTAVDIGGNRGDFSRLLIEKTKIKRVLCIDCDENAINNGYSKAKNDRINELCFAHYDFMAPIVKLSRSLPAERFKADAVMALALTHHLVLTQKYNIEDVFKTISSYATKYVFIEFMPFGLWTTGQEVKCPTWYTVKWFKESFVRFFDIMLEEKIAKNNILFVGKIRTNPNNQ